MPPLVKPEQTKKSDGIFAYDGPESVQGQGGNVADRIKRIIAAKAREALIGIQESFLPDIPLFVPSDPGPPNGGGFGADVAREEKPASRMAPLIVVSVLAGFILLRVFR